MDLANITGKQKAAILLSVLGAEHSQLILPRFKEEEIEAIIGEMIKEQTIDGEIIEKVLEDAHIRMFGEESSKVRNRMRTNMDYAKNLLSLSFGELKSRDIMERLGIKEEKYFDFIQEKDVDDLVIFLNKQLPRTIALVLLHLEKEIAAQVFGKLSGDIRTTVINKATSIRKVNMEAIETLRKILEEQLRSSNLNPEIDGTIEAAEILRRSNTDVKNEVLENLEAIDARLRDELEKQMFRFEGLSLIDNSELQIVFRSQDISTSDIAFALKSCMPILKNRILSSLPPNRREDVEYEMETMGRVRLSKVEEAQQSILEVVRTLVDRGEISLEEGDYVE